MYLNILVNWYANMAQGNKNDSILYYKGNEGIGKSTFSDFLREHVLGPKVCCNNSKNVQALKSQFNMILCAKLFIVFEEMPTYSGPEWAGVSSTIKDLVTNKNTTYEDKFMSAFECANLNNYQINTNVDAIKHSEGRRYFHSRFIE